MRIPWAAKTLSGQVLDAKKRAKIERHGEPDGLGVVRTLKFDKTTSKWLEPLLTRIGDKRIAEVNLTDAGHLYVTFVGTRAADDRTAFPLEDAKVLLDED